MVSSEYPLHNEFLVEKAWVHVRTCFQDSVTLVGYTLNNDFPMLQCRPQGLGLLA